VLDSCLAWIVTKKLLARFAFVVGVALSSGLFGCGAEPEPAAPAPPAPTPEIPYDTLSAYGFFQGALADLKPTDAVIPYDVVSPLWSDSAHKKRFLVLPQDKANKKIAFGKDETWAFPDGSIIIKHFSFPVDKRAPDGAQNHIETRLLIADSTQPEKWTAHTYVWNEAQTEAYRKVAGKTIDIPFLDEAGKPATQTYIIPNTNQCGNCHERNDQYEALGLVTQQVNFELNDGGATKNQLVRLSEAGVFDAPLPDLSTLPALVAPFGDALLDTRARAYLHANCSHCHRPGGGGGSSGLVLLHWETTPTKNGVCKGSVAAGAGTGAHAFDIVPGSPDDSIMIFRMSHTDPEIKMPEIPNLLPHQEGITLISSWIAAMMPPGCP